MTTISISIDKETKREIDRLAKEMRTSRSEVIRELFAYRRLERSMQRLQAQAAPILEKLGLETEEDIAAYAKRLK